MEQDDSWSLSAFDKVHPHPVHIHKPDYRRITTFYRARGEVDDNRHCGCEHDGDKPNLLIHFFLKMATLEELPGSTTAEA